MQFSSKVLIDWYEQNKRELPWRDTTDPYLIWISEIILQQTRVNQGMNYYLRFVKRFPSVKDLENAEQDEVLKYWQGLGYYSRARNLHKAAQKVVSAHGGVFPKDYDALLQLPGVGVYTASAICSFAFNQPYPVVDGNVYRVLSRLFGIETAIDSGVGVKLFAELALTLIDKLNPGLYNQAMMEFGALQCVPVSPDCSICPFVDDCRAFEFGKIGALPVKKQKVKVKERFFNYFFVEFNDRTFLNKRTKSDIWENLYEFPLIESDNLLTAETLMLNDNFLALFGGIENVDIVCFSKPVKHVLTHRIINAAFITIRIKQKNKQLDKYLEIPFCEIEKYAVSRLIENFLDKTIC